MRKRIVIVSPEARDDIDYIHLQITLSSSVVVADKWLGRLERHLEKFDLGAERGTIRDEVRKGVRIIGYRRTLSIALKVDENTVKILRVFRKGRNWRDEL